MARLSDFSPEYAEHLLSLAIPDFGPSAWAKAPELRDARVAIISTAGLHRSDDAKFTGGSGDYRLISGDIEFSDLSMSHVSINFDRSGFQQDANVVFPLERLRELESNGEIGSVAKWHYSFMGATDPTRMAETGPQVARLLKEDGVTAAILVPI